MTEFDQNVYEFIETCNQHEVRLLMVGGTAVNYHGYRRHSADVDFWIDSTKANLKNLKNALNALGFAFEDYPDEVYDGHQNISLKVSPEMELELLTTFSLSKSFDEAYKDSEKIRLNDTLVYRVINLNDLLENKQRSGRPKDLLDIQELKKIRDANKD
jgi:hypothetical protein